MDKAREEIIDEILAKCIAGEELSGDECVALETWLDRSNENRIFYEWMKNVFSRRVDWGSVHSKQDVFLKIQHRIVDERKVRNRRILKRVWLSVAASVFFAVVLFLFKQERVGKQDKLPVAKECVSFGKSKALLKLADGDIVELKECAGEVLSLDSLFRSDSIRRTNSQMELSETEYNVLVVPLGSEYSVSLSDGTKIYMNSGSELRYPIVFNRKCREVFLSGEAYFDVVRDSLSPFVVKTMAMDIRVLGTSFNVRAYSNDSLVAATLEKGRVIVACDSKCYDLEPGKQAVYNKKAREIEIRKVDTELYTSWKSGYYKFEKMSLERIMSTLSLWYDLNVMYENSTVKNIEFTGRLKRYESFEMLLKKFEQTNEVKFVIEGRNIEVRCQ